jgi:hypothetical protein
MKKQYVQTFESFRHELINKLNENTINEAEGDNITWKNIPVQFMYKQFKFNNGADFWKFILELKGKDFKMLTGDANPASFITKILRFSGNESTNIKVANGGEFYVYPKSIEKIPAIWTKVEGTDILSKEIDDNTKVADYELSLGFDAPSVKNLLTNMGTAAGDATLEGLKQIAKTKTTNPDIIKFSEFLNNVKFKNEEKIYGYVSNKESLLTQEATRSKLYTDAASKFDGVKLEDVFKKMNIKQAPLEFTASVLKKLDTSTLKALQSNKALPEGVTLNNTDKSAAETKA